MTPAERLIQSARRDAEIQRLIILASESAIPECVVCDDLGCEFCGAVPEPWPAEAFTLFGVTDLEQLARDIDEELSRRAGL